MQSLFKNILAQFRDFYKNLTPMKRMSMIAVAFLIFFTAVIMLFSAAGTDFAPVLTNIPADQTSVIVDRLQAKNIPYRIQDGGKTITVPKDLVASTQMALMSEVGSGKLGTLGLELFDKQDFGTSSYSQRINYQRALQGELVRAINTLDAVKRSKVMLALPPKATFLEEGGVPTASVVIELEPGKSLSDEQVRGISHLVASAVERLDPEKVTVVDSRGRMLSKNNSGAAGTSSALIELKTKMEQDIQDRVESILSKVVGQGKVIVRVNAELNNRQTQLMEESVDPEKTALLSTQSEEERLDGSRTNPTGVPGARANLPQAGENGQVGFSQNVAKEMKTQSFVVPKTVRNVTEAAGGVERVSVSVLVDGVMQNVKGEDGKESEQWQPRSAEEIAKFEAIVKSAVGFNEKRGDTIQIESMKFEKEDFSESERWMTTLERKKLLGMLFKWLLLGGVVTMFFLLVIRPFMRWVTDSFQDSVEDLLPRTIEELEELQSVDNSLPGMSSALPILEESLDPDKAESELLRERIMTLMEKDEEKAAGAFSLWLIRRDA